MHTMSDSYLIVFGWLFFAAWSAIVFVVSLAAFSQELFPSTAYSEQAQGAHSHTRSKPEESEAR